MAATITLEDEIDASRGDMLSHVKPGGTFLLTSLQRDSDGTFRWRFNLRGLQENYSAVRSAPTAASVYRGPVLFIKGGESNYITSAHRGRILSLFPAAEVRIMPGCGHWLHAQHPVLFNGIVGRFLDAQSS